MTEEQALLSTIATHHREDTPRLMYSDWLEENGRPEQAQFIREHRTGKALEKLRSTARAASGSANTSSKYTASGGYRESVAAKRASREASRLGRAYQHEEAVKAHDQTADLHDEAGERGERDFPTISYRWGHMIAAADHRTAAYHHDSVLRHLVSPAHQISDEAFDASEKVARAQVEGSHPRRSSPPESR